MQKEMSRKEFLITLVMGLSSIFGFSALIHLLTGKSVSSHINSRSEGYRSSDYGGISLG
jgi:hypothetical protein